MPISEGLWVFPARLSKERRDVALRTVAFALEDHFSTGRCRSVEAAIRRRWRRDRQLIKLQRDAINERENLEAGENSAALG